MMFDAVSCEQEPLRIWRISKIELIPYTACVVGVLFLGIEFAHVFSICTRLTF